jgi:hypothetical protein
MNDLLDLAFDEFETLARSREDLLAALSFMQALRDLFAAPVY